MKLRTIIVDDEPVALRRLERLLAPLGRVEVVGTATTGVEASEQVAALRPDLLLVDIEMPGESGLAVVARLDPATAPVVIFVTAYSQYALEAFGVGSADYLLKPIEPHRLEAAIERACERVAARTSAEREAELRAVVATLRQRLDRGHEDQFLRVRDGWTTLRIPVGSILWLAAERDYVRIHAEGRNWLVRGQLRDLEARLPAGQFQRVHRSAIVRLAAIAELRSKGDRGLVLTLTGGHQITVSRSFVSRVRDWDTTAPA